MWTIGRQGLDNMSSVGECMYTGEVNYIRNGHHISTLMHVDTTLPLWALFDIYGAVQKVKLLGKLFNFCILTLFIDTVCYRVLQFLYRI